MVPSYIRKDTIQPVSAVTSYNIHSSKKIRPPKAKTNIYKFHFIRTLLSQWNKLPEQMYQNKSLGQFKNSLRSLLFPPTRPKYFDQTYIKKTRRFEKNYCEFNCNTCYGNISIIAIIMHNYIGLA